MVNLMTLIEHLPDVASIIVLSADTTQVYIVCVCCYFNVLKTFPALLTFSHLKLKLPYAGDHVKVVLEGYHRYF